MTTNVGERFIPNEGPDDAKIIFIGEAGGVTEENGLPDDGFRAHPFIGESGNILTTVLGRNGLQRSEVYLANLCHYRPLDNRFEHLTGTKELEDGLNDLKNLIASVKPAVICTLGNWPLYHITGKQGKARGTGILNWRGSILTSKPEFGSVKVIRTVHPAAVLRDRKLYPIFDQDIKRAVTESAFRELRLPQREHIIVTAPDQLEHYATLLSQAEVLSVDIETFGSTLACVGFSPNSNLGVCIVWDGQAITHEAIQRILSSPAKKVFHFGTFDTEYLYNKGFTVNNYAWDTMVAQHVMWPELPRALKYLTSIYTREPYYKDEGKESLGEDKKSWGPRQDHTKLWIYNCKDTCVTREIYDAQLGEMKEGPPAWDRFMKFEMKEVTEVAPSISRAGLLVDQERRSLLTKAVMYKLSKNQELLGNLTHPSFNVNSPKQVHAVLYDALNLPARKKRDGKVTADADALISLIALCKEKINMLKRAPVIAEWHRKFLVLKMIMFTRADRKMLSSYLLAETSRDGRMRSLFSVPATETGRWGAYKYIDDTGVNAMTFPRESIEIPEDLEKFMEVITIEAEEVEEEDDEATET